MKNSSKKHYKTTTITTMVEGKPVTTEYDNRTLLNPAGEKIKIQHYENLDVRAIPLFNDNKQLTGATRVVLTIKFGSEPKTYFLTIKSPRRIDVINECIVIAKSNPMYRQPHEIKKKTQQRLINPVQRLIPPVDKAKTISRTKMVTADYDPSKVKKQKTQAQQSIAA